MDSTFSASTPMDDSALNDLLGGITTDAEATLTGTPAPSAPETPPMSAAFDVPPADATASEEAVPDASAAAPSPDDQSSDPVAPHAPTPPVWDSPDNPFYQQAQGYKQFIDSLHQRAQVNEQAKQLAVRNQIIEEIPNMEPDKARWAAAQLLAWDRQQAEAEKQALIQQYEPYTKEVAIKREADKHSLTKDEIAQLYEFEDPRQMAKFAERLSSNRKSAQSENAQLRSQLDALQLRMQAQERMGSPADRVIGAGDRAGTSPEDATNLDDFVAGLAIPHLG